MSKKRGRPKGAKNIKDVVDVLPSRCRACGSSRRTAYENCNYQDFSGTAQTFIGLRRRRCRCVDCGQPRIDREEVFAGSANVKAIASK